MKKILIVDDNADNVYLLEVILKGKGFDVMTAANGAEALDAAYKTPPDMIISDILMPVIGLILGRINFENLKIVLTPAVGDVAEAAIKYGSFIQKTVNFVLIAAVVFFLVKFMNRFRRKKEEPKPAEPPKPSEEVVLLTQIRDLLKK